MMVEWIPLCRESETWKLYFLVFFAANTRSFNRDATTTKRDFALRGFATSGRSIWISLPARTAEILTVLLHHCLENLLS